MTGMSGSLATIILIAIVIGVTREITGFFLKMVFTGIGLLLTFIFLYHLVTSGTLLSLDELLNILKGMIDYIPLFKAMIIPLAI